MLHNGGSKPVSKICKREKTAALVMACNGISPKGRKCAAVPCMLSGPGFVEVQNCAEGAEQIGPNHLRGGGGLEFPPPTGAELLNGILPQDASNAYQSGTALHASMQRESL